MPEYSIALDRPRVGRLRITAPDALSALYSVLRAFGHESPRLATVTAPDGSTSVYTVAHELRLLEESPEPGPLGRTAA